MVVTFHKYRGAGGGGVAAVSPSTDDAVVRFNGTTGAQQNSGVTLTDNEEFYGVAAIARTTNFDSGISFDGSDNANYYGAQHTFRDTADEGMFSVAPTGVVVDVLADVIQLRVKGHSTQTALPFVVENDAGTDQFTVSNAGVVVATGAITGAKIQLPLVADMITPQGTNGVAFLSRVANGATADAFIFNTSPNLTTSGANLFSVMNDAVEKLTVDKDGVLTPLGGINMTASGTGPRAFVSGGVFYINANDASTNGIQLTTTGAIITKGLAVSGITAVKTAAYTATAADSLVLADPNAAAGSFAITLPAANAAAGQILTVKVTAIHATRVITVIRAGADTIEGVTAGQTTTTFTTTAALASATFQSDGTSKWYLIGSNGTVT